MLPGWSSRGEAAGAVISWAPAALLALLALFPLLPGEVAAQFGRNRVRYEAHDFRHLETPHLDLYHPPGLEEVATQAAILGERAYSRLSALLQHDFREPIPILLYGSHHQFQQTNALTGPVDEATGGVTEFFKRRVVLPFTGSWQEFEHVLVHELVHAFQLDIIHGEAPAEALLYGAHPPLWFMEGMAEYVSAGLVDSQTRAWVQDGVLTGYLPDLETLGREGGYLSYRYGQAFWSFVAGRWGEDVVGEILQRVAGMGAEGAFVAVTGLDAGALGREWAREAGREVLTDLVERAADAPGVPGVRPLSARRGVADPWDLAPALSPDGRTLAHLSTRGGESFDLWLVDASDGAPIRRLARGGRSAGLESLRFMRSAPSFSPDGGTLALSAASGGRDVLVLLDVDDGGTRRLELPLRTVETPSWAPDGERLVLAGTEDGPSRLWVVGREGDGLRPLTAGGQAALHPAWSPDGRWIAFVTEEDGGGERGGERSPERPGSGVYRVALLELETGEVRVVPGQTGPRNINPVWSPDGRVLVWGGDGGGLPGLMVHEVGSREVLRLEGLEVPALGITPLSPVLSWSRAGPLVAVALERAGFALYRIEDPLALPRTPVVPAPAAEADGGGAFADGSGSVGTFREESLRRALRDRRPVRTLRSLLSTGEAAMPDTSAFRRGPVRTRLTPDLIAQPTLGARVGSGYGNGLYGGGGLALSDILGNHRVVTGITMNGSLRDTSGGVEWTWARNRWDLVVGLEQTPYYRWVRSTVIPGEDRNGWQDTWLRELDRRARLGLRYPLNVFRRLELGLVAGHEGRDLLEVGFEPEGKAIRRSAAQGGADYVQGTAAWVHDDTRWRWNRPVGGTRARLDLVRSRGGIRYDQVHLDLRHYRAWGSGGRGPVLALRAMGLLRQGPEADLRGFYWGGPMGVRGWSSGSFGGGAGGECEASRDGVDGGSPSSCPVRDQLVGSSGALASAELRVPLVEEVRLGMLGSLPPVELVGFLDGGMAWSRRVCADGRLGLGGAFCAEGPTPERRSRRGEGEDPFLVRAPVGAWGLGVRLDLLVVRMEIHHAFPLDRPGRGGVWGLVLGPPF